MAETNNIPRREARTVRAQWKFRPTLASLVEKKAEREGISETAFAERALEKEVNKIPLLGEITCGALADIPEENIEGWFNVGDLYKTRPGDYLLKAVGSSMQGAGIDNGDYILIRPQNSCDSGDIAAVVVDYPTGPRATLKRVIFNGSSEIVQLVPMNPEHETIEINIRETPLRICGVRRGVIKAH